jgi:hypothetical protein
VAPTEALGAAYVAVIFVAAHFEVWVWEREDFGLRELWDWACWKLR